MHFCLLTSALLAAYPAQEGRVRIVADAWDVEDGDISLCREMSARLTAIRSEHAAWAYETAFVPTRLGPVAGALRQGSSLSAWWCSILYERHPKISPAFHTLYLLRTAELLLCEGGCTSLEVHGLDATAAKVLQKLCAARGWAFRQGELAPKKPVPWLRRIYEAIPAPFRALLRLGVWLVQVKRHLPRTTLAPAERTTGTIATYFPNIDVQKAEEGIFRSRYWESLHDALEAQTGPDAVPVRWLFIRFPSPQGSLRQCIAWARGFAKKGVSGTSFNYLEEFLDGNDMLRAFMRYVGIMRASLGIQEEIDGHFTFRDSALDFWPLLAADYVESFRGWRCLERCLMQQGMENYVREAGRQAWYTFPMENCPWERMLCHAAHEQDTGPIYGAQHSTIRPADFRYFDDPRTWENAETLAFQPDLIAGNGESACSQWRACHVPDRRLGTIEALRYLYLAGQAGSAHEFTDQLLVVTSFFEDETRPHIRLLADCLREGIFPAAMVTIKPHPYLPVDAMLEEYLGSAEKPAVTTTPLPGLLADHPVVWASNSTTAVLEAAIMGLPVLVMQPAGDFDLCPLQDIPGLARTSDVASVHAALAAPAPLAIAPDYFCLDPALPRWRSLLGLAGQKDSANT